MSPTGPSYSARCGGCCFGTELISRFIGAGRSPSPAVFTAALGAFYDARIPTSNPLAHHSGNIQVITIVGLPLVILPAVVGIFLIQLIAGRCFRTGGPQDADIDQYLALRRDLQRLLAMLGGLIALVTLATGALRKAVIASGVRAAQFPPEIVLLWGGAATTLLLAAYVPAHLTLASAGRRLRDAFLPVALPGTTATWPGPWSARRRRRTFNCRLRWPNGSRQACLSSPRLPQL
jgi:hypothetical protein